MKKVISVILLFTIVFMLCSCNKAQNKENNSDSAEKISEEVQHVELDIPVGEYFAIVEAIYTTKQVVGEKVSVKLKIQNHSEIDYQMVEFGFYSYDKNGDQVGSVTESVSEMEAGHSTWTGYISTWMTIEEFNSIRISDFEIQEWIDDNTVTTTERIVLNPKPEIFLNQMTEIDY